MHNRKTTPVGCFPHLFLMTLSTQGHFGQTKHCRKRPLGCSHSKHRNQPPQVQGCVGCCFRWQPQTLSSSNDGREMVKMARTGPRLSQLLSPLTCCSHCSCFTAPLISTANWKGSSLVGLLVFFSGRLMWSKWGRGSALNFGTCQRNTEQGSALLVR